MYSLYRAWLMREAPPPDVLVSAGSAQFAAHRHVLAAHSGYLKALLAATPSGQAVAVNVGPEALGPLLSYMYTGYLDVNAENIYSVLLATHLLHMPRALDLCRGFLLQSSPPPPPRPAVVKPIASRTLLCDPPAFWPALSYPLPQPPLILPADNSSFTAVSVARPKSPPAIASTSRLARSVSPSGSSCASDEVNVNVSADESEKKPAKKTSVVRGKVILDVACCDGPVRFHRVLNQSYGQPEPKMGEESVSVTSMRKELAVKRRKTAKPPETETRELTELLPRKAPPVVDAVIPTVAECNETIDVEVVDEDVEMKAPSVAGQTAEHVARAEPNPECLKAEHSKDVAKDGIYTCVYCNHTFKSHYCYQKHARRHLNPVAVDLAERKAASKAARREVRALDMNVQYYPCKTCGGKFPSYYFVHKHRKLCHADEADDGTSEESQPATLNSV